MSGKIYLIQDDETLHALSEQPYASEDRLQFLLAKYPDLLAGDQMNEAAPRRWLLVSREYGVPDTQGGAGRWSLDHLFLDQDGIPTLVEVKRSSDTRARREVVAQMLDYAANGVVYWPVEKIRAEFEAAFESEEEAAHQIAALVGSDPQDEATTAAFWSKVKINLQSGRIRMIFVADEIPNELRRIVEFLNEQMDPAEVLAVEIKQYVGEDLKTLVPRVVGQTAEAQRRKSTTTSHRRQWDETSFFEDLKARNGQVAVNVARSINKWAKEKELRFWWGQGKLDGSFYPMLDFGDENHFLFSVWTYGRISIHFEQMQSRPPFDAESKRRELLQLLNANPAINIAEDRINLRPSVLLTDLTNENDLEDFLKTFEWMIQQITSPEEAES